MAASSAILRDSLRSLKLWRVWRFLGLRDIRARFRGSYIGPLWLVLNVAIFVGGVGGVYGSLFGQPMGEFLPYLTIGYAIWGFLVASIADGAMTFVNAEGYIKQFSFPKQVYLARSLIVISIVFLVGLAALVPIQIYFHSFSLFRWVMAIPGFVVLILTALGHITIFAYLGARFRDLPHAAAGVLQVLFFVTPVMYPAKVLAARHLDFVYKYNPLYYLIEMVRKPVLEGSQASLEIFVPGLLYMSVTWMVAFLIVKRLDSRVVYFL